jgi:hypothetical protein
MLLARAAGAGDESASVGTAATYKHLGVASCASGVCHGKSASTADRAAAAALCAPRKESDVNLREYFVWQQCDRHSAAYSRLRDAPAQKIAEKLGIPNAVTAKICLDCHADNVPASQTGPKFKLTDGVGCEACHGGSEKWIEVHKDPKASHEGNVRLGMYPSDQPLPRAQLCLGCHLGTRDRFATHMIMGAGHPRLSFELESFTANQPAHYVVDADYVARKGRIAGPNLWITGQLEDAERYLTLLQTNLLTPAGITPELAFYDCFGCHHSNDNLRWTRAHAGPGMNPGAPRLQRQNFVMLEAVAETIDPDRLAGLSKDVDALGVAGQHDVQSLRASAAQCLERLRTLEAWSSRAYSDAEVAKIRRTLLRYAADDKASDFSVAEQLELGIESLSHSLNDYDRHKAALDVLYDKVKSGAGFNSTQFADAARRVAAQF